MSDAAAAEGGTCRSTSTCYTILPACPKVLDTPRRHRLTVCIVLAYRLSNSDGQLFRSSVFEHPGSHAAAGRLCVVDKQHDSSCALIDRMSRMSFNDAFVIQKTSLTC